MLIYDFIYRYLMGEIISVYVPLGLRRKIDVERGETPRSRYIVRILEDHYKDFDNEF